MIFLKFVNSKNSDTDFKLLKMTEKISIREKVGFSLGDSAANFIFQSFMLLQLSFSLTHLVSQQPLPVGYFWLPGCGEQYLIR